MAGHQLADRTSLALHREVARRIAADPGIVQRARERLARLTSMHPYYREAWERALSAPIEELCALLGEDSERARDMRQASPFAGALDPATRLRIWREARGR
jgi:hypothetical protein